MNGHFGPSPAGPAPAPDGLSAAFHAADRRRLRTFALTSAMPALLATVLSVAPAGNPAGLEPTGQNTTAAPSTAPASAGPSGGPRGGATGSPAAFASVAAPLSSAPSAAPPGRSASPGTPKPTAAPPRAMTFTGPSTSVGGFTLTEPVEVTPEEVTGTSPTEEYGFYLQSEDGRVAGGVIHLGGVTTQDPAWWPLGRLTVLTPGRYRVWIVGDGPTTVRLPVARGRGLEVRVAEPARTATVGDTRTIEGPARTELRLPVSAGGRVIGVLSASATEGQPTATSWLACLTATGGACSDGRPKFGASSGLTSRTAGSAVVDSFHLRPGVRRDVLVEYTGGPGARTVVAVRLFLVYLDG